MVSSLSPLAFIPTPRNRRDGKAASWAKWQGESYLRIAQVEAQTLIEDVQKLLAGFGYTRTEVEDDNPDRMRSVHGIRRVGKTEFSVAELNDAALATLGHGCPRFSPTSISSDDVTAVIALVPRCSDGSLKKIFRSRPTVLRISASMTWAMNERASGHQSIS